VAALFGTLAELCRALFAALTVRASRIASHAAGRARTLAKATEPSLARVASYVAERSRAWRARVAPQLDAAFESLDRAIKAASARLEPVLAPALTWLDERSGGRLSAVARTIRTNAIAQAVTVAGLAIVVVSVGWNALSAPRLPPSAIHRVTRGPIDIRITERGNLRALDSVTLGAQDDVPVIELAPEGSLVKKGDLLIRFDADKRNAELGEAQSALQVAQAEVRRAEQELEAQRNKLLAEVGGYEREVRLAEFALAEIKNKPFPNELAKAKIERERAQVAYDNAKAKKNSLPELVEKGFITQETMEEAELGFYEAQAALQAAQYQYETISAGAAPQELELADLRLQGAKFALERAKSAMDSQLQSFAASVERETANIARAKTLIAVAEVKLKTTALYAPRDGLVVYATPQGSSEKPQLGMIPFEGQPLIYLPDLSTMVADTQVNEIDIGKVVVGGRAEIRLEAYPGTAFEGKVLKIGSLAKLKKSSGGQDSGIKVFDITVAIDAQDSRLKPGLTAVVEFLVDHRDDAVSVPLSAITSRGDRHYVSVMASRQPVEREVRLGASNDESVIIEEGLEPGDQVVLGVWSAE
jgi:HlyD family secretion protein